MSDKELFENSDKLFQKPRYSSLDVGDKRPIFEQMMSLGSV